MATSSSQKTLCATCGKITGLFTCRGCQKNFCTRHVNEHRQELGKQMDELTFDHDQFRQHLTEQTTNPQLHPLMIEIDQWEQTSIDKIHHVANQTRTQLQSMINEHTTKITKALTKIADELRRAREDDDFFETNLKQWVEQLDQLKKDLTNPSKVKIQLVNHSVISSIPTIIETRPAQEIFERSKGNIRIDDDGLGFVKFKSDSNATVRGNGEYSRGQHRFRFKIETLNESKWLFIGIVSKPATLEANSYCGPLTYGWAGRNQVYLGGLQHIGYNGYKSDIEQNDIVELFMDCDHRIIRLKNERTRSVNEIRIESNKCAFPWQINFDLYLANDRIRIL